MTQFIQQYMPEITMVAAILLPLMPTIIVRIMSDKRLQTMFSEFRLKQALDSDTAKQLYNQVTSLKQQIESLVSNKELQLAIQNTLNMYRESAIEVNKTLENAMTDLKLISNRLEEKDEIIAYLTKELKDIKMSLGVRT